MEAGLKMNISRDVINFLQNPTVRQLLATNNFEEIYRLFLKPPGHYEYASAITEVFLQAGIDDLLGYVENIPREYAYALDIKKVYIPNNVKTIGFAAFAFCPLLESVIISKNLTHIDVSAFMYCERLSTLELPQSLQEIGHRAFNGTALESITIPENVDKIPVSCFQDCTQLRVVTFKHSGPLLIEPYAFSGCESLLRINFEGTKEEWEASADESLFGIPTYCRDGKIVLE